MNEASGNLVVSGDPYKVYDFIQKYNILPDRYEPWQNDGDEAITTFDLYHDLNIDIWLKASKVYPDLKLTVKYQLGLAAAYRSEIVAGTANSIRFDWNDGTTYSWSETI